MMEVQRYLESIDGTDLIPEDDIDTILMGLFGEVGEIMASAKKVTREGIAFTSFKRDAIEEFGDAFWYLAALSRRLKLPLVEILAEAVDGHRYKEVIAASSLEVGAVVKVSVDMTEIPLAESLVNLGSATTKLINSVKERVEQRENFVEFARAYLLAVQKANLTFSEIMLANVKKARGRFLKPDFDKLPTFDSSFPADEQLPWKFEIEVSERRVGRSYMRWNGVFIGDPLTDNIKDPDGYRFHDVFHFGFAAILHWSPTFRALIKHKRKSCPKVDEAEDGGRAIVVEEGLSAWIFSCAKEVDFFRDQERVSFDLLKTIQEFVRGYEVEIVPLWMWEKAILDGYEVFREVRDNGGGIVVANRKSRSIQYKPLREGAANGA